MFIHPKQIEKQKKEMFKYITYSAFGKACYKSQSLWTKCPRILFQQILQVHVLIVTVSDLQLDKPTPASIQFECARILIEKTTKLGFVIITLLVNAI